MIGACEARMAYGEYNASCRAFPAPTYAVQRSRARVWKIGGLANEEPLFTFRVSDVGFGRSKVQTTAAQGTITLRPAASSALVLRDATREFMCGRDRDRIAVGCAKALSCSAFTARSA